MQLPTEIIIAFGEYLAPQHLASAIRVCQSWNDTLVPLLYNAINGQHISREALVRNGHYIRNLNLCLQPSLLDQYLGEGPTDPCIRHLTFLEVSDEGHSWSDEDKSDSEDHERDDDDDNSTNTQDGHEVDSANNANNDRGHKRPPPGGISDQDREYTAQVMALIKQNKNLSAITFNVWVSFLDWRQILGQCPPTLLSLWLYGATLTNQDVQRIFSLGPQLRTLAIMACRMHLSEEETKGAPGSSTQFPSKQRPSFPNLTELIMDNVYCEFDLPKWMANCPQVNDLTWLNLSYTEEVLSPSSSLLSFAQVIQARFWSRIQSLQLPYSRKGLLTDVRVAQVLDGCAPLTKVALQGSEMWLRSMVALERHYPTLESINVTRTPRTKSWMYQTMLTSCPRLLLFAADAMYACELVTSDVALGNRAQVFVVECREDLNIINDGHLTMDKDVMKRFAQRDIKIVRPWVCTELGSLHLGIKNVRDGWDEQIFAQISKLKELVHLDVSMQVRMGGGPFEGRGLDFRLRSGLGLLETIKGLTSVKFDDYYQEHQEVGKDDYAWILKHWPYLTMVNEMSTGYRD